MLPLSQLLSPTLARMASRQSFSKSSTLGTKWLRAIHGRSRKLYNWSWIVGRWRRRRARLDARLSTALKLRARPLSRTRSANNEARRFQSIGRLDPLTNTADPIDLEWPLDSIDICSKCEAMTGTVEGLEALLQPTGYKHFNWYDLQYTARMGCRFCEMLWYTSAGMIWRSTDGRYVTREEIRVFADVIDRPSPKALADMVTHPLKNSRLRVLRARIPASDDDAELHLYPVAADSDPASDFITGRMESKELSSATIHGIKEWLSGCINEHSSCPRGPTPQLPRRVLDIGSGNTPVSLYQSHNGTREYYATLSYCWGENSCQVMTTSTNLEEHMRALPSNLPKTILDAIEVCRKIGIRYLWVDALCIIQDDENDKLDQISKMGVIYKHSTVTIVASGARSSTEGFLGDSKPNNPNVQLPLFVDSSCSGTMGLRYSATASHANEPLFYRAWTLQELLLSPRVLLFTSSQIMLRCMEYHFQPIPETHIKFSGNLLSLPSSVLGLMTSPDYEVNVQRYENDQVWDQHSIWQRIVEDYSGRNLTHFHDRLPALAGIAGELASYWKSTYLAGLWDKTIIQDLGWRGDADLNNDKHYVALDGVDPTKRIGIPSWSWASVPFRVRVETAADDFSPDAKMIDHTVVPMSQISPFGSVGKAYLTLDAQILRVSDLDAQISRASDLEARIEFRVPSKWPHPNSIWLDFEYPKHQLDQCQLLYLGHNKSNWKEGHFLAVEKFSDEEFTRVGFATFSTADTARLLLRSTRERIVLI